MDVEEFVRRRLADGMAEEAVLRDLSAHIMSLKNAVPSYAADFSRAVIEEVKNTRDLSGDLFAFEPAGVSMGEFGVGSRGTGDFFAHRQIARVIGKTGAEVGVDEMDDAGVVRSGGGEYIVCTVDGMHSRLSDFPFLAGFHVTRATLRDVYVMGARPIMLFSDIHVADDGDVAKIFDYTAGITTVGDLTGVPLVSGSTLRIGGDMVLGTRMTGCVGLVGVASHITPRRATTPGDLLLMTTGAGGGTIATAAMYSGFPDVVDATMNLDFLRAADALIGNEVISDVHAMTDVTNGGLRGDIHEMADTAECTIVIEEASVAGLVEPRVRDMLEALRIDYLGVSLDALLIVAPPDVIPSIRKVIASAGVESTVIGHVKKGPSRSVLVTNGKEADFSPRFRESAYTPVKKVVDRQCRDFEGMRREVERSADAAIAKKNRMIGRLRR